MPDHETGGKRDIAKDDIDRRSPLIAGILLALGLALILIALGNSCKFGADFESDVTGSRSAVSDAERPANAENPS